MVCRRDDGMYSGVRGQVKEKDEELSELDVAWRANSEGLATSSATREPRLDDLAEDFTPTQQIQLCRQVVLASIISLQHRRSVQRKRCSKTSLAATAEDALDRRPDIPNGACDALDDVCKLIGRTLD